MTRPAAASSSNPGATCGNTFESKPHVVLRHAPHEMRRTKLVRMLEACGLCQLAQRGHRVMMKPIYALRLVGHRERRLPQRILRRDTRRASARCDTSVLAGSRART